ncbi:MAG: hypothetical protein AAGI45_17365 [Cyanobacteria bacterium P01_H01_bin.26]
MIRHSDGVGHNGQCGIHRSSGAPDGRGQQDYSRYSPDKSAPLPSAPGCRQRAGPLSVTTARGVFSVVALVLVFVAFVAVGHS